MRKNTEINLVGQQIFNQILNLLDPINLVSIAKRYDADPYYKIYTAKTQLITMNKSLRFYE